MSTYVAALRLYVTVLRSRLLPRLVVLLTLLAAVATPLLTSAPTGSGHQTLARAASLLFATIAGLAGILGGAAVATDVSTAALRAVLLRPVSRVACLLAQATVLVTSTVLLYGIGIGLAVLLCGALHGYGPAPLDILTESELDAFALKLLALPVVPLLAAPLLGLLVSVVIHDVAAAILVSLTLIEGPFVWRLVVAPLPRWSFTEHIAEPLDIFANLARGITLDADRVDAPAFGHAILTVGLVWVVASLGLALFLWRRREVRV